MTDRSDVREERTGVLRWLFDAVFGRWIAAAAELRNVFTEVDAADKRLKADEE